MRATFLDTGYALALTNSADTYHQRAVAASGQVRPPFVTTEAVLVEIGNALSRVHWRALGYATVRDLLVGPQIEIVTVDRRLLQRALDLYGNRPDKEWGLTDCISFVVMTDRRIKSALTFDHHFAQAGFTTLIG